MAESTYDEPVASLAAGTPGRQANLPSEEKAIMSQNPPESTMTPATRDLKPMNPEVMAADTDSNMPDAELNASTSSGMLTSEPVLAAEGATANARGLDLDVMEDIHSSELEDMQLAIYKHDSNASPYHTEASEPDWVPITMFDPRRNRHNPKNEFGVFSKLPMELRVMIWKESVPAPRIFTLEATRASTRSGRSYIHYDGYRFNSAAVPVILQVCKEAREVGLRFYELIPLEGVADEESRRPTSKKAQRFCRVDFRRDYFICLDWCLSILTSHWKWERLERLVLPECEWWKTAERLEGLQRFPALKELAIFATSYEYRWERNGYDEPGIYDLDFHTPDDLRLKRIAPDNFDYFGTPNFHTMDLDFDNETQCTGLCAFFEFVERKRKFPAQKLPVLKFAKMERISDVEADDPEEPVDWDHGEDPPGEDEKEDGDGGGRWGRWQILGRGHYLSNNLYRTM